MSVERLTVSGEVVVGGGGGRLDSIAELIEVLSPVATLRRGYSITRVDGRAVVSVEGLRPGTVIETTLADGVVSSNIL